MMLLSGMVPVANSVVAGMGSPAHLNTYNNYNYTVIQNGYQCSQNPTNASAVASCKPPTPNNNVLNLVFTFGDWLDAMIQYLATFATGIFLPYFYLTKVFLLDPSFAAAINVGVWGAYAALIVYIFGNRNLESQY